MLPIHTGHCIYAAGKLEFIQQSLNQWRVRPGSGRAQGRALRKLYFFYENMFYLVQKYPALQVPAISVRGRLSEKQMLVSC